MKNACVKEISEIPMNEEHEYDFKRNQNDHYLAATKSNALNTNLLFKHYGDMFCLKCFWYFQSDQIQKERESLCKIMTFVK